ncbi:MAG: YDG domain-containing protein, partial [Fibromonadales bacterium]|nr:YDG domain-containing protein [Fibromonadales bacterium]
NFNNANAGTDKPVTATGYGITGADAANYTVLQPAFATANITPLQLKWNANGTVRNKTYDGTRTATVSTAPALVGILGNDDVRPAVGAVNFDNMNIGTSKDVTATGYEITGTSASNYITPTAQPSFAKANITPLQLTWANGTVSDKTYDGTTTATTNIQPALNGVIEDDDVTPVFGSASFSDASAGTAKSVTATGYNIAGSDASNYAIITPPAFATAKITPLQLTWTNGTASDKTYDGTRIATVNIPPALIGIIEGDVVTPSVGTINFSDANVGTDKPVTATGYSIIGTDANNYAITAQPLFATANITHRTITVTPDADQSKVYGTTKDPVLAYTYSGNANGETPGFTGALSRISGDNAGSYAISKGSLAISDNGSFLVSNYTPLAMSSAPVYFTITKATGTGWVKIEGWYAGETPNSPNPYSETNPGAGVTYKYQGVSSTEYPLQSTPPSNPGSYKVTAAFPPAENHYFSAEAFFEVKQKANVQVIWTPACGHEYIYNGKEQRPTPSAAGYASSDFVLTGAGTNADSYTMTAELKTPDKGVSLQNAACPYTIAEKQLTVSWDAQREFTYNKMVQYPQASVKDGETNIPLHISGTQSAAGTHSIMAIITNELTRKNYALQSNTMDYTIFKKDLTPKFQTTLPDFEYKNDTLRVPTEVFQDTAALQQILDSIVAYEGFATDTVKKETDDAKILTGKAKVKIDYDDQDGNSQGKQGRFLLAKRVETTQKATATIITDDVSADNYKPLDRSITIVEMGDDDEGGPATFCKREDGRCIALNAEICEFIYGEVVPTCGEVPIPNTPNPIPYTPVTPRYYSLKGTFLGTIKPTAPGIYIEARGVKTKKIIVK